MIRLNGQARPRTVETVGALLAELGIPRDRCGIAVARNGAVVARSAWETTPLADGDQVEVIRPAVGG